MELMLVEFDFFTDDEYIDIEELIEDRIDGLRKNIIQR